MPKNVVRIYNRPCVESRQGLEACDVLVYCSVLEICRLQAVLLSQKVPSHHGETTAINKGICIGYGVSRVELNEA